MLVATVQTLVCKRCKWLDLLKVTGYSSNKYANSKPIVMFFITAVMLRRLEREDTIVTCRAICYKSC
jgi:hypothetical protein